MAVLSLSMLYACGGTEKLEKSSIVGYWQFDVTTAEYISFTDDNKYQTYNGDGDCRFSGEYIIDGDSIVLDGKSKDDADAFMVLTQKDKDTFEFKGITTSEYKRINELPSNN